MNYNLGLASLILTSKNPPTNYEPPKTAHHHKCYRFVNDLKDY